MIRKHNLKLFFSLFLSIFFSYRPNTSLSNLKYHLSNIHLIVIDTDEAISRRTKKILSCDQAIVPTTRLEQKQLLARSLAYLCAVDLLPLSLISGKGFHDFLLRHYVVKTIEDIPSRQTVSGSALDDVYYMMLKNVKSSLTSAPKIINLVTDMWTSSHGCLPYITIHVRFCDDNLVVHNYSLKTEFLARPHTGEAIKASIKKTLSEFGLSDRYIIGVGDGGSNVKKLGRIYEEMLTYLVCMLHRTHNGLTKDIAKFKPWEEIVLPFFKLLRKILQILCYRAHLMSDAYLQLQAEDFKAFIVANDQLFEELTADEMIPQYDDVLTGDDSMADSESDDGINNLNAQYGSERLGLEHNDALFTRAAVIDTNLEDEYQKYCAKLDKPTRLAKPNATRWLSSANMVASFLKNKGKLVS
jgi:hypothetical protein